MRTQTTLPRGPPNPARGPRRAVARPDCGPRSRHRSAGSTRPRRRPRRRGSPRRAALVAPGDVAGEEGVAGADRGDRFEGLGADLEEAALGPLADHRRAAVEPRYRRLSRAEAQKLGEAMGEVDGVGKLLARQLLGLALVGSDHRSPGAHPLQHRLAVGVEDDGDLPLEQILDQARVEVVAGAGRKRARQDADAGARGEVVEAVDEAHDLLGADGRAALVDLGLLAGGRVDHGQVDPRLSGYPREVGQHRLLAKLFEDPGTGRATDEPGCDHRLTEQAERAGDVDPLATSHGPALDRAVTAPEPEVGNGNRPVDRGVESDCEDHCAPPPEIRSPLTPRRRIARPRRTAPISITNRPIAVRIE